MSDAVPQLLEEPEGPRLRETGQPPRARRERAWRQDARTELRDLADLYPDLPEVRIK
ncbi:hypothetical protein [Streptomyces sp. 4F14]|uniref:hypothetical protein n=1 Tax=Streptomyces sp. 4F14 TaxID=3394380 RepID=UPI003A872D6A